MTSKVPAQIGTTNVENYLGFERRRLAPIGGRDTSYS
jgi:hypothetical protein